jgi:hypothetical protein
MDNIDEAIDSFRCHAEEIQLGVDFETRVFFKIKRKKRQRTVTVTVVGICLVITLGIVFQSTGIKRVETPFMMSEAAIPFEQKEIPVSGDVVFAASDKNVNYIIEQVAYVPNDDML